MVQFNKKNVDRFKYFIYEWVALVALLTGISAPFVITAYIFGGVGVLIFSIALAVVGSAVGLFAWLTEPELDE